MKFYALSDVGLIRKKNQDAWSAEVDLGFFALADGIGGRKGGDVAAQETIRSLCGAMRRLSVTTNNFQEAVDFSFDLRRAIQGVNSDVYSMGCEREHLQGMGSTLCCLLSARQFVYCAHVGDSRAYLFRDGRLQLLTHDHSLFARWLTRNRRDLPSPPKNIITRAIGMAQSVNPEISCIQARPNDIYFLCTDGLTNSVEHPELQKILSSQDSLEVIAKKMILSAKNKGSSDNITVLVVKL